MSKKVTLDTNVFQHVIRPSSFPNDPDPTSLQKVHDALKSKRLIGFVADPIAHIEQIPKAKRSSYFAGVQTVVAGSQQTLPDGTIKYSMRVSPDPSAHPGLPGILVDCLKEAVALGVTVLRCPRIALPMAPEIDPSWYAPDANQQARQAKFFDVLRAIEVRGVGIAALKAVGLELLKRDNKTGEWHEGLALARDQHDEAKIKKAWAEWADADAIAAHIAYENDYFCTRDDAVAAGISILNQGNRQWLEQTYQLSIVSPTALAKLIGP
ncbi:hypothetical protein CWO91_40075 [Bradyrhizobium genosp. SA-3]|uniref:hypothetical protein n=1 Tax=Bradyrhizobium genosp. SA-3 TaxID=508868 RepID=UPI00102A7189|nr:hypothetical protein [Bradyrhizobium genosp. SA-3]RZM93218.1 hypothetical protein CWO91_40075 [Bradyrhizobium genosp. SA-3]